MKRLVLSAAQFTWNREKNVNFAAYMGEEEVINEEEEEIERRDSTPHQDNINNAHMQLSDIEQGL